MTSFHSSACYINVFIPTKSSEIILKEAFHKNHGDSKYKNWIWWKFKNRFCFSESLKLHVLQNRKTFIFSEYCGITPLSLKAAKTTTFKWVCTNIQWAKNPLATIITMNINNISECWNVASPHMINLINI